MNSLFYAKIGIIPHFLLGLLICLNTIGISAQVSGSYLTFTSLNKLYLSADGGTSWQTVDAYKDINKTVYFTASAVNNKDPSKILLGTSFEGIYESVDGGKNWKFISESRFFRPLSQGAGFFDEVVALSYDRNNENDIFFRIGFGGQSYHYQRAQKKLTVIDPQSAEFAWLPSSFRWNFSNTPMQAGWQLSLPDLAGHPRPSSIHQPGPSDSEILAVQKDPNRQKRLALAAEKRGIYLNPNQASNRNIQKNLDLVVKQGMNSIVVDFKDDQGLLTYNSTIPLAKEMRAINQRIDVNNIVKLAHERNIYVIARIVIFKDKKLFAYNKNAHAIWDRNSNKPWGVWREQTVAAQGDQPETKTWVQTEYWVDPYDDFVHQYNLDIAKELQSLGVDEIQLDYIRFPSDGHTANILCRGNKDAQGNVIRKESMDARVEALTSFLRKVRQAISIPIGTDVFGFNSWARMSYLGQDIQAFSYFVDVISPMNYPSHYARDFLGNMKYFDRAEFIFSEGLKRARWIVNNRTIIRPYIQAFLLGGERKFSDPQIYSYLNRQVKGGYTGGGSGFTLWNQSGNYYMIEPRSFKESFTRP